MVSGMILQLNTSSPTIPVMCQAFCSAEIPVNLHSKPVGLAIKSKIQNGEEKSPRC